jgi:predicted nuclease of predicted toxin-antitoxin system
MAKAKGRLFADVQMPIQIVHGLRRLGYDVKTMQQHQGTSEPDIRFDDEAVLEIAIKERRAFVTIDRDFRTIHIRNHNHQGIIICNDTSEHRKRAKEIDEAIKDNAPLLGKLIHVPPKEDADC